MWVGMNPQQALQMPATTAVPSPTLRPDIDGNSMCTAIPPATPDASTGTNTLTSGEPPWKTMVANPTTNPPAMPPTSTVTQIGNPRDPYESISSASADQSRA